MKHTLLKVALFRIVCSGSMSGTKIVASQNNLLKETFAYLVNCFKRENAAHYK